MILNLQKRARELGRIRIGQVVPTSNGKTRPEKLDRFRLTSASEPLLQRVAELYGGKVEPWTPQGGGPSAFEVVTTSTRLPIMVPPQPVSQWYETWSRAGCVHRCDGRTNVLTAEPCDLESDEHVEALKRPTTRLNVVLRDVEGIGVWRLETHGWNAAVELPDAAEFLAQVGGYVNGWVSLEERVSVSEGKTRRFMVPTIEIDVTPAQLMAGGGRVATPQVEGPVARPAIEAAPAPAQPAQDAPVLPTLDDIEAATNPEVLRSIWNFLGMHDALTGDLKAAIHNRVDALKIADEEKAARDQSDEPVAVGEVMPEVVESLGQSESSGSDEADADAVWRDIIATAGKVTPAMTTTEVVADFKQRFNLDPGSASAAELSAYLTELSGAVAPF